MNVTQRCHSSGVLSVQSREQQGQNLFLSPGMPAVLPAFSTVQTQSRHHLSEKVGNAYSAFNIDPPAGFTCRS